ncbi:MAG: TRAP transporter substrate-binding protein DctP [Dehalococcoidales bacterium]|nr:TRAP transporter substrate-binding protein DctP [Dehalococcoidales bacterium]
MKKEQVAPLMVFLALVLIVSLVFIGCSGTSSTTAPATSAAPAAATSAPAPAGLITFKIGYDTPPTTNLGVPVEYFAKEVNSRLAGRVKVDTYPAGSLASQGTGLENVRTGVADAYVFSFGAHLNSFPVMNFTSLPALNFYPDTVKDMETEVATMKAILAKYPAAQEETEGLKLLWSNTYSTAVYMGNTRITKPDDIKSLKIGCDGMRQEVTNTLGGVPVFTIPPNMYQQLQTNLCDGVLVAWGAALDWQLQEQVKYAFEWSFGGSQMPIFMNEKSFNKLSPEDQKVFMEIAAEAEAVNRDEVYKVIPQSKEKFAAAGVEIYSPTPEEKKLWLDKYAVIWQKYIDDNKAAGVTDIESIFNDWKTAVDEAHK